MKSLNKERTSHVSILMWFKQVLSETKNTLLHPFLFVSSSFVLFVLIFVFFLFFCFLVRFFCLFLFVFCLFFVLFFVFLIYTGEKNKMG